MGHLWHAHVRCLPVVAFIFIPKFPQRLVTGTGLRWPVPGNTEILIPQERHQVCLDPAIWYLLSYSTRTRMHYSTEVPGTRTVLSGGQNHKTFNRNIQDRKGIIFSA